MLIVGAVVLGASLTLTLKRGKFRWFFTFVDNPYGLAAYSKNEFFDKQNKKTAKKKKTLIFQFIGLYGLCGVVNPIFCGYLYALFLLDIYLLLSPNWNNPNSCFLYRRFVSVRRASAQRLEAQRRIKKLKAFGRIFHFHCGCPTTTWKMITLPGL